jgi:hypothetical protein
MTSNSFFVPPDEFPKALVPTLNGTFVLTSNDQLLRVGDEVPTPAPVTPADVVGTKILDVGSPDGEKVVLSTSDRGIWMYDFDPVAGVLVGGTPLRSELPAPPEKFVFFGVDEKLVELKTVAVFEDNRTEFVQETSFLSPVPTPDTPTTGPPVTDPPTEDTSVGDPNEKEGDGTESVETPEAVTERTPATPVLNDLDYEYLFALLDENNVVLNVAVAGYPEWAQERANLFGERWVPTWSNKPGHLRAHIGMVWDGKDNFS